MQGRVFAASLLIVLVAAGGALAQQKGVRVSGTVESFDGHVLAIKSSALGEVKIELPEDVKVFGVSKATLADVKPGAFIGVGGLPQADGIQRAIQVTVFAESQRGLGEGFRPWSQRPHGTMTNATVAETVKSIQGERLTVKYRGGEKTILVPPGTIILAYSVGDKRELKPGAHVAIVRAQKQADGSLRASRVNVGRGGVEPK
ncbi:MAG TPA: hypothetical protein VFT69_02755 [Pseudolabrys sp.]|jgi:hypothetical protein|nr:hypothetical protein [Pseudolabrys sp.]